MRSHNFLAIGGINFCVNSYPVVNNYYLSTLKKILQPKNKRQGNISEENHFSF